MPDRPRPGARRRDDVPPDVRARLNAGVEEARTLAEILVVDFGQLLRAVAPEAPEDAARTLSTAGLGVLARMALAAQTLHGLWGKDAFDRLVDHPSDTVRGWAAFVLAREERPGLARRYDRVRPLADDPNPGVREWAWIALRPRVAADLEGAIAAGLRWTSHTSPNLRRYAVEITRPRGVWCAHLGQLKADPSPGLPLLEPLRADGTKYVQDSVANWLNDAAKSRPDWVRALCARWERESKTPATQRIIRRALRSL